MVAFYKFFVFLQPFLCFLRSVFVQTTLIRGDYRGVIYLYMKLIEDNMILYYADFLSLKDISIPVTDNCKYYYIHDNPINSAYLEKR
jgi:hypothetical protein